TKLPLDVHLMIENPDQYIKDFAEAGADIITVHQETCPHLHRTIQLIKNQNVKAGVVINPATPVAMIKEIIANVDLVLVMSVNPGPGRQSFISSTVPKIKYSELIRKDKQLDFETEVEGGANVPTAKEVVDSGTDVVVAGSAIFNQPNRKEAIKATRPSLN